jgi:sedoheptulokinase
MKCLGIDIGSTSIKGAVLDLERRAMGELVTRAFPAPLSGLSPGWIEIDPRAVCDAVNEVVSTLIQAAPEATQLYCTGQMGGVILADEHGQPLSNFISWRDQRTLDKSLSGESYPETILARWEAANVLVEVGRELAPGGMITLLAWLREHDRLPMKCTPMTIADYVLGRLIDAPMPMHVTQAVGMLDLTRSDWHRTAFGLFGLENVSLPPLVHREGAVGSFTLAGRKLQVFGSYGDQQTALRGAGLRPDELSLNISTGSQVSRRVASYQPGDYWTRRYFFGEYLNTVTHLPAGRSLNVLVDLLTELARDAGMKATDAWTSIIAKAAAVASTDLEVDLAFFSGPLGDHGRIGGITTDNLTVGNLFHAAFRAMADNYASVVDRLGSRDWQAVVLSGGLTQAAPLLRQLISQRFPVPLRESAGEETLAGLLDIAISVTR